MLGVRVEGNGVLIRTADALILHQKFHAPPSCSSSFLCGFAALRLCAFALNSVWFLVFSALHRLRGFRIAGRTEHDAE